jgi:urease accessory protein
MTAFAEGLAQLFAPTLLLAVLALGLLAGQGAARFPFGVLAACASGLAVGSVMIAAALRAENTSPVLLAGAALCAGVVAAGRPVPQPAKAIAACATGGVLAFNAPPQAITIPSAVAEQIGTALAALAVFAAAALVAMHAEREWQRIGLRIGGSWIAASAILVLALRLMR